MEIITSILLPMLFWFFEPQDIVRLADWFENSKPGKIIIKSFLGLIFGFLIYIDYLISLFVIITNEFSINGIYLGFALFFSIFSVIALYFHFTFKDLFFPKNKSNQKPFSIV